LLYVIIARRGNHYSSRQKPPIHENMSIDNLNAYRAARLWLERDGDGAIPKLRLAVAEAKAEGDLDSADRLLQIITAIEELQRWGG
jgi:hypothetical protein